MAAGWSPAGEFLETSLKGICGMPAA